MKSTKKCATEGCRNKALKWRTLCCTCKNKRWKKNNYLRYCYDYLMANARRRNKIFTLTFDDFVQFCIETNYDKLKGKTSLSMSIDCKIQRLGYTKTNIRAITLSENSSKGVNDYIEPEYQKIEQECPF